MTSQSSSGQGLGNLLIGYNPVNSGFHEIFGNEKIQRQISFMYRIFINIDQRRSFV